MSTPTTDGLSEETTPAGHPDKPAVVKPVLKHATSSSSDDDDYEDDDDDNVPHDEAKAKSSSGKKKSRKNRHLKWDEAKIQEHDQLRGTRMKIEEPNTPYAQYDSGSETDGSLSSAKHASKSGDKSQGQISWDALTNKLEAHAAAKEAYPSSPSSHGNNEMDDDEREKELKHLEFKEHRKRHYNEMELVRKFRQEHPDGPLNDENNDADDENE